VPKIAQRRDCLCATALENAIMTDLNTIPKKTREKLGLIINKYLPE